MTHAIRSETQRDDEHDIQVDVIQNLSGMVDDLKSEQNETITNVTDLISLACQVFEVDNQQWRIMIDRWFKWNQLVDHFCDQ